MYKSYRHAQAKDDEEDYKAVIPSTKVMVVVGAVIPPTTPHLFRVLQTVTYRPSVP
jgi:hypothetical protein